MIMKTLERLKKKKKEIQEQMQRGRVVTEQMKAEKLRRKGKRMGMYEPGTIRYGIAHKQNPLELMEEARQRRKEKREEQEGKP